MPLWIARLWKRIRALVSATHHRELGDELQLQDVVSTLQVNLRRFVVMPLDTADRAQVYDDRPMDLRELLGVELLEQFLERHTDYRLGRFASVAPGGAEEE